MSVIETFNKHFAALDPIDREEMEAVLLSLILPKGLRLPSEKEVEIYRRHKNPNPAYASSKEVESILGRTLSSP